MFFFNTPMGGFTPHQVFVFPGNNTAAASGGGGGTGTNIVGMIGSDLYIGIGIGV